MPRRDSVECAEYRPRFSLATYLETTCDSGPLCSRARVVGDVKGDWDMTDSKSEAASLDEAPNYPQRKAQENIKSQAFTKQWRDRPLQTVNNWDLSIMVVIKIFG